MLAIVKKKKMEKRNEGNDKFGSRVLVALKVEAV